MGSIRKAFKKGSAILSIDLKIFNHSLNFEGNLELGCHLFCQFGFEIIPNFLLNLRYLRK